MAYTDFLSLARERFSVRLFKNEPVEQEAIDRILLACQLAPTGCNNQPQRVFVIQSEEALEKLRRCTKCHFGAPLAMLVACDMTQSWKRRYDGADSGWVDASIAATHMMLAAHEAGVGSCWVMHFDPEAMRSEFELPENIVPVALLVMGYPSENAKANPLHDQTKSIDELCRFL